MTSSARALDVAREMQGLSDAEVLERRQRGEGNIVRIESGRSYRRIVFDNVVSPVNVTLFVISAVLIALGLYGDAVFTAGLVLGNAIVGVFQEGRAKRQLDHIALLTRPTATVIRNGEHAVVSPEELVKDDLVVLQPGDQVQVDGSVLSEEGLSLDESLLTGESDLVRKRPGDQVHSGSFVMAGTGIARAENVGANGLAQQITSLARTFKNVRTPLQREIAAIIWIAAAAVLVLSIAVLDSFRHVYDGLPLKELTRAAAVIVALVPQGLWFMVTITYAMAIVRLARSGALIQRINSVESISHVDVLALDKTGTLTTNELKLESIVPLALDEAELRSRLGQFAASASFSNRTNEAILKAFPAEPCKPLDEITFDSARKWSALVLDCDGQAGLYVLGAPEMLLPHLKEKERVTEAAKEWTEKGLRVLLLAYRPQTDDVQLDDRDPVLPADLIPAGLAVLSDELRHNTSETLAKFAEGGIKLKIISGDNPETVAALVRQAGVRQGLTVVSGAELDAFSPEELAAAAERATVFGRVSPHHKQQLIQALQKSGHYVAMIGDGVNDVPALKTAEVAVSVKSGSPVSRSVADIVLLDDSFAVLPNAFLEGQRIRRGMENIIRLFLVRTLSVALIILGVAILREQFPVTPRHTAVIATLTVGLPSLALASWSRPGQSSKFLLASALEFVLPAGVTIGLAGIALYSAYNLLDADVGIARTALTAMCTLCGIALIPYVTLSTSTWLTAAPLRTAFRPVLLALAMLALFSVSMALPILRRFYELEALRLIDYAAVLVTVLIWALTLKLVWHWIPPAFWGRLAAKLRLTREGLVHRIEQPVS